MVEIPTVVLLCLFQGLVAGLLRPRPSLKQIGQSSKQRKVPWAAQMINIVKQRKKYCETVMKKYYETVRKRLWTSNEKILWNSTQSAVKQQWKNTMKQRQ